MQPQKRYRQVIYGQELENRMDKGVDAVYHVARSAYGPKAGNVLISHDWGGPRLSRDGVTNVTKVLPLNDTISNDTAEVLVQASKKNNQTVGDGTTATVLLAAQFYREGRKLIASGHNRMEVSRSITEAADKAIEQVENMGRKINDDELLDVAKVSCGDDAIGALIADTVTAVGSDGGVMVEEHSGLGIYNDIIDGMYMRRGFTDLRLVDDFTAMASNFTNAPIMLLGKTITDGKEMKGLLDRMGQHQKFVILGDVGNEALDVLLRARIERQIVATLVAIPATAGMKQVALEDIAIITGGKVYQEGQKASSFDVSYLGAAEKVVITELSTIITGGAGDEAAIKERLVELEKQLDGEMHPVTTTALKDRIARLEGKVGIIKVGGATDIEREELRLRIDDAVCALQAARKGGIVPGGGTALARVKDTPFDDVFRSLFVDLMENAGDNAQLKLGKTLEKPVGYGYNLKDPTDEPIDLFKAGVVDPTLVVTESVRNAASVASKLITVQTSVTFEPTEAK